MLVQELSARNWWGRQHVTTYFVTHQSETYCSKGYVCVCVRACVRALAGEYIKCLDTIPFRRKDVSKRLLGWGSKKICTWSILQHFLCKAVNYVEMQRVTRNYLELLITITNITYIIFTARHDKVNVDDSTPIDATRDCLWWVEFEKLQFARPIVVEWPIYLNAKLLLQGHTV